MKRFAICCLAILLATPATAERLSPNDIGATSDVGGITTWSDFGTTLRDAGDCDCIDLVFIIDDTGSMSGAIANVAAGIGDIQIGRAHV